MTYPATSTLKDWFATATLSLCWQDASYGGGTAAGDGPGLVLTGGSGAGGGVITADLFDLTGDAATIEITTLPAYVNANTILRFEFTVPLDDGGIGGGAGGVATMTYRASNGLTFCHQGAHLDPDDLVTIIQDNTTTLFTAPGWWQIRDAGSGRVEYRISSDGVTWASVCTAAILAGASLDGHFVDIDTQEGSAVIATYNGGGVPSCPTVPFVPAAGRQRATCYLLS